MQGSHCFTCAQKEGKCIPIHEEFDVRVRGRVVRPREMHHTIHDDIHQAAQNQHVRYEV